MSRLEHLLRPKIVTKLVVSFLLIALVPMAIVSSLAYFSAKQQLTERVTKGLLAAAESKAYQIEGYFLARKRDVTTLSHTPTVMDAMERFNKVFEMRGSGFARPSVGRGGIESKASRSPHQSEWLDSLEYGEVDRQVRPFLTYYQESAGFSDLFLISPKGDAVFSINKGEDLGSNYKAGAYKDSELAKVFDHASTLLETEVSDFGYYPATNESAAFIASPIIKGGAVIGVVALQMSNKEVYQLVSEYVGLGQTGETVIGSAIPKKVFFVTPVRHDPHAAFRRAVTYGSAFDMPLQDAAQAKKGDGIAVDYRGKQVLAAWRYLPSPRWGMVVKIDADEAFAPIHDLKNLSLIIGLIAAMLVVLIAPIFSKSFSDPIVKLTRATGLIAAGDLAHRANVISTDEIGELAVSFNTMALRVEERTLKLSDAHEALWQSHERLEEHVAERTADLVATNRELESFSYSVAHDLRSPLRGIDGFSKLLLEKYETQLDIQGADFLRRVRDGVQRMGQIIDNLLSLSKITRVLLQQDNVDLSRLARERVQVQELRETEHAHRVEVIVKDGLFAQGDPGLLSVMLTNLLGNAFKFSSRVPHPVIEFGALREKDRTVFFISDNGAGFNMEHREQLFAPFGRLHSQSDFPGTGIGLAIVQRIVGRHRGTIWAEAAEGRGAKFFWTLPTTQQKGMKNDV